MLQFFCSLNFMVCLSGRSHPPNLIFRLSSFELRLKKRFMEDCVQPERLNYKKKSTAIVGYSEINRYSPRIEVLFRFGYYA